MKGEGPTSRPTLIVLATASGLACLAAVYYLPIVVGDSSGASASHRWEAEASARTALVQLIVGLGALSGAVIAARSFGLSRATAKDDRLTRTVTTLTDADATVSARAGAAYVLGARL